MTLKPVLIVFFISIVISYPSLAAEKKYGADFLQGLISAEGSGVGGSSVAYSIGARSLNNNPAGLAFMEGNELFVGFHKSPYVNAVIMRENEDGEWSDHSEYNVKPTEMEFISYTLPLSRFGNLGLSFAFNYSGRFIRVNKEGKAVNAFPKDDMLFVIGYSLKTSQGISAGIDIKSIRSKVPVDNGSKIGRTYAMDVGLMHQMGKHARAGVVLQNIGNKLSFGASDIPSDLRKKLLIGAVYNIKDDKNSKLSLSMDVNPPFEDGLRYNFGAELVYSRWLIFRAGYMRSIETYYDPLINLSDGSSTREQRTWIRKGPTIGLGLRIKGAEVNFARTPSREPILNNGEKLRLENQESVSSFSFIVKF